MKKNTISKVLLVFVMIALIFSLAACGGNKNEGGNSGGGKKTTELTTLPAPDDVAITGQTVTWGKITGAGEFEYIAYKSDGSEGTKGTTGTGVTDRKYTLKEDETSFKVRAIPADTSKAKTSDWSKTVAVEVTVSEQVLALLGGVSGLIDTFNAVEVTSTLSADLGISGYFNTANSINKIKLDAKANANSTNPEALINFQMNDKKATTETMKDYVSLGYKANNLYVREPMNFINTDATVANAFKIDTTALATCVPVWMGYAMEGIAKQDINFDDLSKTVESFLTGKLSKIINSVLKKGLTPNEDGSTTLGLTVDLLGTATEMLDMIGVDKIKATVDEYIGYANKALEVMNNMGMIDFKELQLNGEKVTFDSIIALFQDPSPEIKNNSVITIDFAVNSDKVIEKIDIALNLGAFGIENVDYKMGLTVDLKTFSTQNKVTVSPSTDFEAKDIVIDLKGALPQKGLENNTVVGVIRLSNGLANATNKWADVTATTTGGNKSYAYVNAAGAYADFSGVFATLGVADTYKAKYSYTYDNLITKLIANVVKPSNAAPKNAADEAEAEDEDIMALIMGYANGIGAADNKADYISGIIYKEVIARFVDKELVVTGKEGQKELIQYLFDYKLGDTNTSAKDYALFYKNAQTFEALLDNLEACHKLGKPALDASINTDTKIAGIQLFKEGDNNDLLDYVAKFVVIPTIKNGEPSFTQEDLKAPNDKTALKGWLDWIFPYKPDNNDTNYRKMVEDILGITLGTVIDSGVYVEAKGNTGLDGEVCVAADSTKAKTYVSLGAGIAIKAGSPAVSDITAQVTFNAKNEETQKYYIAEAGKAMLDKLRTYTAA